ncbi:hypothetical protein K488DRAFT_90569 [Vararia minispora EC-137]|uniref:Uncharacterized protein n=1 Tax=Vararia minispora EC-137 TaxID=1314806 RepID=A0ACB8Q7L3_9AGAM|nr:hypothetical protein K488DRAFT_90569 [Vararia minispora EC-137]
MAQCSRSSLPFFLRVLGFLGLTSLAAAQPTMPSYTQIRVHAGNTYDTTNTAQTLAFIALNTILALGTNETRGVVNGLDIPQTADLVATMAEYDEHTGSTTFKNSAIQLFRNFQRLNPTFTSETARWGLAAYHIYSAYNDGDFLVAAENIWNQLQPAFVDASDSVLGHLASSPGNVAFNSTCPATGNSLQAVSVQGAVFFTHSGTAVNGETIGPFIVLSSHLFHATQNDTYSSAAKQSIDFFTIFLTSGAKVFDTYNISSCSLADDRLFTYNAGFFIEGVSVYANVTGNYTSLTSSDNLHAIVSTQITAGFGNWTCPGGNSSTTDGMSSSCPIGIFNADTNNLTTDWKAIFVHGLYEYMIRSDPSAEMTALVERFISLQFHAVLQRAAGRPHNVEVYGLNWNGPPPSMFTAPGQLAAAELFNIVYALPGTTPATSLTIGPLTTVPAAPTTTANRPPASRPLASRIPVGAIIGGSIGAVIGFAFLAALIFFLRRPAVHKPYYQSNPLPELEHPENVIDPFLLSMPASSGIRTVDETGTSNTMVQREPERLSEKRNRFLAP